MSVKSKPTSPDDGPPREQPEPALTLQVHRCPYCHTDLAVATDDWVACRQCLARHHRACWAEGGRCASCGDEHVLQVADARERVVVRARPTSTLGLLAHGAEGVGRVAWLLLRLPMLLLRGVMAALRAANAWPRLTGAVVVVALLIALAGASQRRVVYHSQPYITRTVTEYRDPPQKTPRQRARDAAAQGQFEAARLDLERLVVESPRDAALWEELGWARLAGGLAEDARAAYARALALQPGTRRWGEVFAHAALGDRDRALEALGAGLAVNDPTYGALWTALLGGGRDGLAPSAARATWQGVLARWGQGTLDDEAFLAEAMGTAYTSPTRPERLCEAHAYVALAAELRGDRARAVEHYRAALETRIFGYIEYVWASARLRALQGGAATLGPAPTPPAAAAPTVEAAAPIPPETPPADAVPPAPLEPPFDDATPR